MTSRDDIASERLRRVGIDPSEAVTREAVTVQIRAIADKLTVLAMETGAQSIMQIDVSEPAMSEWRSAYIIVSIFEGKWGLHCTRTAASDRVVTSTLDNAPFAMREYFLAHASDFVAAYLAACEQVFDARRRAMSAGEAALAMLMDAEKERR